MSSNQYKKTKGFTLIELMIVVSIVAMISAVVLSNMPLYKGNILIDREAGNLTLALRKAQQYSIAVRKFDATISSIPGACNGNLYLSQFPAYGIVLDMAQPSKYFMYADPDCDKKSDTYTNDLIETTTLENRVFVEDICINIDSIPPYTCSSGGTIGSAEIWSVRPGPTIEFRIYGTGGNSISPFPQSLKVFLRVSDGGRRSVTIRNSGQVSIQHESI